MNIEGIYHFQDTECKYPIGRKLHIKVKVIYLDAYVSDTQRENLILKDEISISRHCKGIKCVIPIGEESIVGYLVDGNMQLSISTTVTKLDNGFKIPTFMIVQCIACDKPLSELYEIHKLIARFALIRGKEIVTEVSILEYIRDILPYNPDHQDYTRILSELYHLHRVVNVCKKRGRKSVSPFSLIPKEKLISLLGTKIDGAIVETIPLEQCGNEFLLFPQ